MIKVLQLDPKHKPLLNNHTSGYWQIQSTSPAKKYKKHIMFIDDFGLALQRSYNKHKQFRVSKNFKDFSTHRYIFSNTEFIKLVNCSVSSVENLKTANNVLETIFKAKREESLLSGHKKKYGPNWSGPAYRPKTQRGKWMTWEWSFKHPEHGKYEHVFQVTIDGEVLGKSRSLFCKHFNLSIGQMYNLASGKIDEHRGWTRIHKPVRLTKIAAVEKKVSQLISSSSS